MNRLIFKTGLLILVILFMCNISISANSDIEGYIKDAQVNTSLPGANVILLGTSLGSATDVDGKYVIRNVPPGSYTIKASYIGYESFQVEIQVKGTEKLEQNFSLQPVSIEGQTVVVTGQATGQLEAINKQLSSQQIINAVSSARIQELPDANAAESVGRLPGISILRSGGEGNSVVIRGLAPKYNQILIDGVQMSSSDPFNRSTDLSMISSNMLQGIEVSKTVTADMDANVIGGVVNFELREARVEKPGVPQFSILLQGGYNNLSDAYNKYNNYKVVGSVEDRFFDDKFGVFAQLDFERRNLASNELGASYDHQGSSTTQYLTSTLNLNDIPRDRRRINATIVMDYKLPDGKINLMNFFSSGNTEIQNRGESFDILNNINNYTLAYSKSTLSVITNALNLKYTLPIFDANIKLSHTYSENKSPDDWTIGFQQASAGLTPFLNEANLNPKLIPITARIDTNSTYLSSLITNNSFSNERALTGSIDLEKGLNISDLISAKIKFGGMYRYKKRLYDYDQTSGQGLGLTSARFVDSLIASHFPSTRRYSNTTNIPIAPFLDPNFSYGKFLAGDYKMVLPLSYSMLSELANYIKSQTDFIAANPGASIAYFRDAFNSATNDYSGNEDQSAFYAMATFNIGSQITFIPGVRYQNLKTTYIASRGLQNTASATGGPYLHYDTTVTVNHDYLLPDISLRYSPLSWFDIRLSYTNTISYPDYNAIIPKIDVSTTSTISWNNYDLKPSRSTNYDIYLSFYDNTIGLFTVGGFLKQIDNLIYPWTFYVSGANALKYYPPSLAASTPTGTYGVSTFVNDPFRVEDWGIELDWQTHFWYLPGVLSGLVLNVNYTHVSSNAEYPYTDARKVGRSIQYVDTSFTDRLLYQPDNIVNLSLGYDFEGFSIRVSMLYQADIFTGPNYWPQLRSSTSSYTRWDLAVKQDLPWYDLQAFGNLNNINSANDISVIKGGGVPQSQQDYGMTGVLGLRWKL